MDERTKAIISAIVILAVNIAAMFGVSLDANVWFSGLCAIVMLVTNIYAIWKNHSFTPEAIKAQAYLEQLKAERSQQ